MAYAQLTPCRMDSLAIGCLLALMAREPRFVPYVDIPFQHVARPILAAMRRGGDSVAYLAMIGRMRDVVCERTDHSGRSTSPTSRNPISMAGSSSIEDRSHASDVAPSASPT